MTVIAWDGDILAADRMWSTYNMSYGQSKLHKINNEFIFQAGNKSCGYEFLEWYKNGADPNKWSDERFKDSSSILIILKRDGLYMLIGNPVLVPFKTNNFFAWGYGSEFACGVLACGKSAIDAVKLTSKHVDHCGYGYNAVSLSAFKEISSFEKYTK